MRVANASGLRPRRAQRQWLPRSWLPRKRRRLHVSHSVASHASPMTKPCVESLRRKSNRGKTIEPRLTAQVRRTGNYVAKNAISRQNSPRQNCRDINPPAELRSFRNPRPWSSGDHLCRQKRDFATKSPRQNQARPPCSLLTPDSCPRGSRLQSPASSLQPYPLPPLRHSTFPRAAPPGITNAPIPPAAPDNRPG
jgi:hypothetical protein